MHESDQRGQKLVSKHGSNLEIHTSVVTVYWAWVIFLFGAAAVESLTNIGKYSVGE